MTASEHLHLPWLEPMAVARILADVYGDCLLYTSDAADEP